VYANRPTVKKKYWVRGLEDFVNRGKGDVIRETKRENGVGLTWLGR
jgi:hypothetical protein